MADLKKKSTFYGNEYVKNAIKNVEKSEYWSEKRQNAIEAAAYWMGLSDEEVWNLMFGNTISRYWMVWSDGVCPSCKNPCRMYAWKVDAKKYPWKVQCPHCGEFFPKNDFYTYYKSGLDKTGVFRQELADVTLLTSDDTPGDYESVFRFGIDDGEGYMYSSGNDKRWHFIGYYLIYGQWKQLIVGGISALATAYLVTGEKRYAHKAGILFDRVADLFPTFDFRRQGWAYEGGGSRGYVSTWHDSNTEMQSMVMAYDAIFEAICDDKSLVDFLHKQSEKYEMPNPKNSFEEIQYNIETRIFGDVLLHPKKVKSNYPGNIVVLIIIHCVLGRSDSAAAIKEMAESVLNRALAADGATGERSFAGYAKYTMNFTLLLAEMLTKYNDSWYDRFFDAGIRNTVLFYADTYMAERYYPSCGDGAPNGGALGFYLHDFVNRFIGFSSYMPGFNLYTFYWNLYKRTGDDLYLRIIKRKMQDEKLVCDLGMADEADLRTALDSLPSKELFSIQSVVKPSWHIAELRTGSFGNERAAYVHYETKKSGHMHSDVLHIDLIAYGIDLLPDNGYPPVDISGWGGNYYDWYVKQPYMHNTVTVDRGDMFFWEHCNSSLDYWRPGKDVQALTVSANRFRNIPFFERTLALVNISADSSVLFDFFRVKGGHEHLKMIHGTYGTLDAPCAEGDLTLNFPDNILLQNIRGNNASEGWNATWNIDSHEIKKRFDLDVPDNVHLKCFELTHDCEVYLSEMWFYHGSFTNKEYGWRPMLMTRRSNGETDGELESCFTSVLVPYCGDTCPIISAEYDGNAVMLKLANGRIMRTEFKPDKKDKIRVTVNGDEII